MEKNMADNIVPTKRYKDSINKLLNNLNKDNDFKIIRLNKKDGRNHSSHWSNSPHPPKDVEHDHIIILKVKDVNKLERAHGSVHTEPDIIRSLGIVFNYTEEESIKFSYMEKHKYIPDYFGYNEKAKKSGKVYYEAYSRDYSFDEFKQLINAYNKREDIKEMTLEEKLIDFTQFFGVDSQALSEKYENAQAILNDFQKENADKYKSIKKMESDVQDKQKILKGKDKESKKLYSELEEHKEIENLEKQIKSLQEKRSKLKNTVLLKKKNIEKNAGIPELNKEIQKQHKTIKKEKEHLNRERDKALSDFPSKVKESAVKKRGIKL